MSISNIQMDQNLFSTSAFTMLVKLGKKETLVEALIDTGSRINVLIDQKTAHKICDIEGIEPLPLNQDRPTKDWMGRPGKTITHKLHTLLELEGHLDYMCPMAIAPIGGHAMIIGKGWLQNHGAVINLATDAISFLPGHCQHPTKRVTTVKIAEPKAEEKKELSVTILKRPAQSKENPAPVKPIKVTKPFPEPREPAPRKTPKAEIEKETRKEKKKTEAVKIYSIGAAPYLMLSKQKGVECFSITLKEINEEIEKQKTPEVDSKDLLPKEYHHLIDVFSKKKADELPEHRASDHHIVLEGDIKPGYCPLYNMSREELDLVKNYLEEHLAKGFIQASGSPFASPVLFVRKPGGGLRFCVDYRKLNALTRKDRYPLPLISETLAQLAGAKIYTKLDIRHAFNRIRMATEEDEDLTTFRTRFGSYKYKVMPFGLTNGPATFQHYINDTLFDYLNVFCTAYIDDILIYSQNALEHQEHVRKVLERLREAGLQVDIKKCEFGVKETKFLGMIVGVNGIRMDQEKVEAIVDWGTPTCLKEAQAFIGFCNFYRPFIRNFSRILRPLVKLTKKEEAFVWNKACEAAFQELKDAVTNAPILIHFDRNKQCFVETDSSDYVSSGVLSQIGEDGLLHPVAFFSKKLIAAECNYEIYDKELLAIVRCFEQWRPELEGTDMPIQVLTDHKSLEYFMTTKKLTRRQARWAEFLAGFNFQVTYRPGKQNEKADSLTRKPGDQPKGNEDDRQKQQHQLVLPKERIHPEVQKDFEVAVNEEEEEPNPRPIGERIAEAQAEDPFCKKVREMLRSGQRHSREVSLPHCEVGEDKLYLKGLLLVPEDEDLRMELLKEIHESPAGGHYGWKKLLSITRRQYWFPKMISYMQRLIRNCHICKRSSSPRDTYHGILNPLPIPEQPWRDISLDFVTGLPEVNGYNAILNVVCRLTKMRHFIPCKADGELGTSAEETAKLMLTHVWKHHGLFNTAVSDRGPQFVSELWTHLCKLLKIKPKLSTAFHPETDGQTENANKDMERYLRSYVNYLQDDWLEWLPSAEFAANNTESSAINTSPFFANYGFHPRMSFDFEPDNLAPGTPHNMIQREKATVMATKMKEVWDFLQEELTVTQARMEDQANAHRIPAPRYETGDKVWLSTKNIRTKRPSRKLDHKQEGPFTIIRKVGASSYELELPASVRIHPIFHSSLLRLDTNDPLPGQVLPPPPPVEVDGEPEWEVEQILDSRRHYGRLQYKAKWVGYDMIDRQWYDAEFFENAQELVQAFHIRYPDKPSGPFRTRR